MPRFRKKPVVIDAVQWTGDDACLRDTVFEPGFNKGLVRRLDRALPIRTMGGEVLCAVGDWIIRGVEGEIYPCPSTVFAATYEAADD